MSEKNYLEKLLNGVEVKWKTLGEVAEIGTGNSNRQDEDDNGIYPFYVRSKNILKSKSFQFDETAIIVPGEGGIGDIFHYIEGKYALHQRAYRISVITNNLNEKFLYHLMTSQFKQYILSKSVGSTSISIRKPMLEKFPIPIPPLSVQKEIVRILDAFTAMTAELTAELNLRKQQYQYYRDKLLTFDKNAVEWKTLGEIANIIDSLHKTPTYINDGLSMCRVTDIKGGWLNLNETFKVSQEVFVEFTKRYIPKKGDLVMSRVGSYGNVSIVPLDNAVCMGQNTVVIHPYINPKFLYYFLTSKYAQEFIGRNVGGGSQKTLSLKVINVIPIPIPPLTEQERIVSILDKFDTLTHSISEGLPKEIELRQKQYEYYRNLLLNFPKPEEKN